MRKREKAGRLAAAALVGLAMAALWGASLADAEDIHASDPRGAVSWSLAEKWKPLGSVEMAAVRLRGRAAGLFGPGSDSRGEPVGRELVAAYKREAGGFFRWSAPPRLYVERFWVEGQPIARRDFHANASALDKLAKERVAQAGLPGHLEAESSRSADPKRFSLTMDLWFETPGGGRARLVERQAFTREGVYSFAMDIPAPDIEATREEVARFLDSIEIAPGMEPVLWSPLSLSSPPVLGMMAGALFGLSAVVTESLRRRRSVRKALALREREAAAEDEAPPPEPADSSAPSAPGEAPAPASPAETPSGDKPPATRDEIAENPENQAGTPPGGPAADSEAGGPGAPEASEKAPPPEK